MNLRLRVRLLLAVIPPFVLVAALAGFNAPPTVVAAVAAAAGAAAAVAVVALTVPFERLRVAADEALQQVPDAGGEPATPGRPTDGTGEIAHAIWVILDRLTKTHASLLERNHQFSNAVEQLTAATTAMVEENGRPPTKLNLVSPWAERTKALEANVGHAAHMMAYAFRRVRTFHAMLNELPDGVLVCDEKLTVTYANAAAAKLFPHLDVPKTPQLANCFADPPAGPAGDPDTPVPLPKHQVLAWVHQPKAGHCVAAADDGQGTPVSVRQLLAPTGKLLKGYKVLQLRDAAAEIGEAAAARHRHRRDVGHRLCLMVNNEATPALEAVRTQAGLLSQTAKQTGQKDRFLPKVNRLLEELSRQEVVVTLLGWLGRLNKSEGTTQDAIEVRLRDVADAAAEKVQPMFRERTNALDVKGDGGWLVADEEWLSALVTGLLMHANHVVEQKAVAVELKRRTGGVGQTEQSELIVRYPGPPVPAELAADVKEPFGRMHSTALASSGADGFPLGLAVAARIAKLMGGELQFDHADGTVFIRTLLPTRATHTPPPRMATVSLGKDEPEFEQTDMLGGWDVGGGKVDLDLPDDGGAHQATKSMAVSQTAFEPEPTVVDDTVGNWFGGPAE
jgi:signal transduction histidine kinase/PAS domain-containing protein